MNEQASPLSTGALVFISLYLLSMLFIGWWSYRARKENTLQDYYLAGRSIGIFVLIFTLFSTQYSANTLLGYTGKTYRVGYSWIMCTHFMTAIIVFYYLYAPKLYALSRTKNFITPTDYLNDRFKSQAINVIASVLLILALANFLLGQLMAMGRSVEGLTGVESVWAYVIGLIFLSLIMMIYESLGGMRAVVWTDAIQGVIMLAGFTLLIVMVIDKYGSFEESTRLIMNSSDPATRAKAALPQGDTLREWYSYIFLVGLGGALYPQAIQRIYAAKSAKTLRRSFGVMAFMPLASTFVAVLVGIVGIAHIQGLEGPQADELLMHVLREIQTTSAFGYWLVVLILAAVLAAIMSTSDSILLSISSMFTKDLYGVHYRKNATEVELTAVGKTFSWLLIAALIILAVLLRESTTLIQLLDRKFDLLVQLAPAFFIGIRWKGLRSGPVLAGLIAGVLIAVGMAAFGHTKLYGIHPGLYGLAVNTLISVGGSVVSARK